MKRIMIALFFVLLLSGCPGYHPEMDSIEECIERGTCQYSDKDIKTEGSELSSRLLELLVDEEDDMKFTYYNSGAGIEMRVTYTPHEILKEDNLNLLDTITEDIIDIVDEMYEIDYYSITIQYKYIRINYLLEKPIDSPRYERYSVAFDYVSITDITEEQMLDYIDDHSDQLILVLEQYHYDYISYYSASYTIGITFVKVEDEDEYNIHTKGLASNENIRTSILHILSDNNIVILEPEDNTSTDE